MNIDMNKKYKTRNGMDVRILCTDKIHAPSVVGLVLLPSGKESLGLWHSDGAVHSQGIESPDDLIEVKEKRVLWINIYKSKIGPNEILSFSYSTKNDADESASTNRIACVKVEYENGDGL